jgi:hypothetical protein
MAITTRQLTGPIETPEHEAVETGLLRVHLLYPIAEEDTLVAPFKVEYSITDGDLPATAKIATPGWYEFRIYDYANEQVWSFQVTVWSNSGSSISIAELWLLSRLDQDDATNVNLENVDASILGSDGALAGTVLTADGDGGTDWLAVGALTPGDMTKAVYDTNDDGRVDAADHALNADLAADATLFGGLSPSAYQLLLQPAVNQGAILTWDIGSTAYTPNENFLVDADGNILAGGIRLIGALYGNVYVMNIVYYLVDEETHVLVIKEDDVELRLPDPVAHDGRIIEIKKASTDGNIVSVTSAGGGTIEGGATYDLEYQYEAITVVSANGEWFIF